ncbi:MAG TPA: exodeoxyribonuclease VII large subunit [Acidimicrobiales bacterium]|nr:exodeoxyribonuclease VII large subunit [Acidimicrobiales bacterium]
MAARFPGYPVRYVSTNVSGPGAADAVIEALRVLDARPEIEVIVLARGGGDAAQLLPFSDEALCRAVCESRTPVVSAIGHDGDRPLCDEVADLRCGTPSLAASAVVPNRAELERELTLLMARARATAEHRAEVAGARLRAVDRHGALRSGLDVAAARLRQAAARRRLVHPGRAVAAASDRLARVDWRAPVHRRTAQERERLAARARHLEALSPARVLERGYAVVRRADGSVLRRSSDASAGDAIQVQLAWGRLGARVEETHP